MPELTIDNLKIEVPKGTKVIEAAARLGIIIPRFCYHPSLGSLGACRMCAVKFLEGPVKGIAMSCMEQVRDGMVVSTIDEEVRDFRRQVIEWLMMNHPHDCPVCDEGGHCLLQDLTVAGGHGIRRFAGKKRTYLDQDLGAFIRHEMNRCIHCFRCRRFYQDFAGYLDFGALQIGSRMFFGRQSDGPLESPFSGNIIDLCPTGVLTDKPSRYKGRRWDYERSPALCIHCSLGCRLVASARYREVIRMEAGFSRAVNGYFICDRGRYGFSYNNLPERPRRARIGREEVPLDQALRAAVERISQITHQFGKGAIGCLGSARSSLETQGLIKSLCQQQRWMAPNYLADPFREGQVKRAVAGLDERIAVSLREIEQSDFVLLVGADPVNEAPMLTLALRQAFRKGAAIYVIDPRPVFLPLDFEHLPAPPGDLDFWLGFLLKRTIARQDGAKTVDEAVELHQTLEEPAIQDLAFQDRFIKIAELLNRSERPVIVCGTDCVRETTPALAADLVLSLQSMGRKAGLFYLLPGANSFGAALLSSPGSSFLKILEAIENGSLAGLVMVERNPFRLFPDRSRLEQALNNLDFLLVMDYLPSPAGRPADIFLPTQTVFEAGGIYVNQEGRAQWASPVYGGGLPIEQINNGNHPPHLFREDIPGGEPKPAWQLLTELAHLLSPEQDLSIKTLWTELARENPVFSRLEELKGPGDEIRIIPEQVEEEGFLITGSGNRRKTECAHGDVELLPVEWTLATEELSSYSAPIRETREKPCLMMQAEMGKRLGIRNRDRVTLSLDGGPLEIEVELKDPMAAGIIVLPRHEQLDWQKMPVLPVRLALNKIEMAGKKEIP